MSDPTIEGGVYAITCTANGRQYIGSTRRFQARWARHQHELRQGRHKNLALQADYEQYGPTAFRFEPLSLVEHGHRHAEQRVMIERQSQGVTLYNCRLATRQRVTTDAELLAALDDW